LLHSEPEQAEQRLWKLKYSRAEIQAVTTILRQLGNLEQLVDRPTLSEQYYFFQAIGAVFPAWTLVVLAMGYDLATIQPFIDRCLDPQDQVAHPTPLVTGQDLMNALQLGPSPKIGHLLATLQLARAEGKIGDRESALALAKLLMMQI
jgi:tRNA nucleotidyltransferase (CCA-adding enzyme)